MEVRRSPLDAPSAEEKAVLEVLDTLRTEGESYREHLLPQWEKNLQFFEGYQWERDRPEGLTTLTVNNILRLVVQQAAYLSDSRPVFTIKARREELGPAASVLAQVAEAIWSIRGHDRLIEKAAIDLELFGKAFWKVVWRQDLMWGKGDVSIERVDPTEVITDNVDSLEDATYICHRSVRPLYQAQMLFPAVADRLVPDEGAMEVIRSTRPTSRYGQVPRTSALQSVVKSAVPKVVIEEWLIRDPTILPGEEGQKYPAGRLITRIGEVIAQDIPYPLLDPWPGPWVEMSAVKVRGMWPVPPVQQYRVLQEALNVMFSVFVDHARMMSPGIWIVDKDAIRPEELRTLRTTTSGIVEKKAGSEVRREVGPSLPEGILEVLRMIFQSMEFLAGVDSTAGKVPRGVVAGAALEALQSAAQSVMRLRSREIERALQQAGQRVVARILQYYTDERILVYTGVDGRVLEVIFDPVELKLTDPAEELIKQFVVHVQSGSEIALSREKSYALHAALYAMGAIDRKALLDAIQYPNREEIIQRMEMAEQLGVGRAAAGPTPRGRGVKLVEKML